MSELVNDAAPDGPAPGLRIVGGNPSPEELAAVTAVLTAVLDELSVEEERLAESGPDAWQRSQRPIRTQLVPGSGAWRGFSG